MMLVSHNFYLWEKTGATDLTPSPRKEIQNSIF